MLSFAQTALTSLAAVLLKPVLPPGAQPLALAGPRSQTRSGLQYMLNAPQAVQSHASFPKSPKLGEQSRHCRRGHASRTKEDAAGAEFYGTRLPTRTKGVMIWAFPVPSSQSGIEATALTRPRRRSSGGLPSWRRGWTQTQELFRHMQALRKAWSSASSSVTTDGH